jgi:hypothetical protein
MNKIEVLVAEIDLNWEVMQSDAEMGKWFLNDSGSSDIDWEHVVTSFYEDEFLSLKKWEVHVVMRKMRMLRIQTVMKHMEMTRLLVVGPGSVYVL